MSHAGSHRHGINKSGSHAAKGWEALAWTMQVEFRVSVNEYRK